MPIRPYLVKHRTTGEPRIVEAISQAAALAHVAGTTFTATAASASEVVSYAVRRGIPVETAGDAPSTPEPVDPDPAGAAPGER